MFWNKKKRGFILIYTLLVGTICVVISFYILTLQCMRINNNKFIINYIRDTSNLK